MVLKCRPSTHISLSAVIFMRNWELMLNNSECSVCTLPSNKYSMPWGPRCCSWAVIYFPELLSDLAVFYHLVLLFWRSSNHYPLVAFVVVDETFETSKVKCPVSQSVNFGKRRHVRCFFIWRYLVFDLEVSCLQKKYQQRTLLCTPRPLFFNFPSSLNSIY